MSLFKSVSLFLIATAFTLSSCTKKKEETASPSKGTQLSTIMNKYLKGIYIDTRGPVDPSSGGPSEPPKFYFYKANLYNDSLFIYKTGDNFAYISYAADANAATPIKNIYPASGSYVDIDTLQKITIVDVDNHTSVIPVKVVRTTFSGAIEYGFPMYTSARANFGEYGFAQDQTCRNDTLAFDVQDLAMISTYFIRSDFVLPQSDLGVKTYTADASSLFNSIELHKDAGTIVLYQSTATTKTIQITSFNKSTHTITGTITISKDYGVNPPAGSGPPTGKGPEGCMYIQGVVNFTNYPMFFNRKGMY